MNEAIENTLSGKTLDDLVNKPKVNVDTKPELTQEIVEQVIELLKNIPANGGYGKIASAIGFDKVIKSQVKIIHAAMKVKIAELTPQESPDEEL